jgi:hypothetical protein
MMKAFLHGRTEGVRTVQPESVDFTKVGAHLTGWLLFQSDLFIFLDILFRVFT